jgi:hypothetical protein
VYQQTAQAAMSRATQAGRARHLGTELRTPGEAGFTPEPAARVLSKSPFEPMMRISPSATSTRWANARSRHRRPPGALELVDPCRQRQDFGRDAKRRDVERHPLFHPFAPDYRDAEVAVVSRFENAM